MSPLGTIAARTLLAALWIFAGLAKLFSEKAETAESVVPLPRAMARIVSYAVAALELGLGILALIGLLTPFVFRMSACLLVLFGAAIAVNLLMGRRPACNCFGNLRRTEVTWFDVVRNGLLAAFAVIAANGAYFPHSVDAALNRGGAGQTPNLSDVAGLLAGCLALTLAAVLAHALLKLHILERRSKEIAN